MGESLIQLYRVGDEGHIDRKTLSSMTFIGLWTLTYIEKETPANSVPAAAVRQGELVLFGLIGRKEHVGGKR